MTHARRPSPFSVVVLRRAVAIYASMVTLNPVAFSNAWAAAIARASLMGLGSAL